VVQGDYGMVGPPSIPSLDPFLQTDPDDRRRLRIPLPPNGHHTLGVIELPAGTAAASHMFVEIPPERHRQNHRVVIRQVYENREVGRITWVFEPQRKWK
jgi:hypothetical protein